MNEAQLMFLFVAIGATFAFVYGFVNLIKNKKGYFYSFTVLGLFGFAIGRIFLFFLSVICIENIEVFSLGSLGTVCGFLCLTFACNTIEKIDSIEVKNAKKYKYIALIMPALYVVCFVLMTLGNLGFEAMILTYIYSFSVAPCSYYCLKNIITPYPKNSYMHCLRPFFAIMLVICIMAMLSEMTWLIDEAYMQIASVSLTVGGTLCYIAIAVFLERGTKKWIRM